jgi:hypothetical protein
MSGGEKQQGLGLGATWECHSTEQTEDGEWV